LRTLQWIVRALGDGESPHAPPLDADLDKDGAIVCYELFSFALSFVYTLDSQSSGLDGNSEAMHKLRLLLNDQY
jgi:hypothetical protein